MTETWPSLPGPINQQNVNNQPGVQHSSAEAIGALASERRSARAKITLSLAFVFDTAEKTVFDVFYQLTLNNGNKAFQADWLTDAGYQDYAAKTIETPAYSVVAKGLWQITLDIELRHTGQLVSGYLHPMYKEAI